MCLCPGLRLTCCKSGKDRTGMSATLEQVSFLSREFDLADSEYQRALDTMRRSVDAILYQFVFMERTETKNLQMPPSEMLIFCDLMTVSCEPPKMLAQDGCRFRKRCIIKLVDALEVTI